MLTFKTPVSYHTNFTFIFKRKVLNISVKSVSLLREINLVLVGETIFPSSYYLFKPVRLFLVMEYSFTTYKWRKFIKMVVIVQNYRLSNFSKSVSFKTFWYFNYLIKEVLAPDIISPLWVIIANIGMSQKDGWSKVN